MHSNTIPLTGTKGRHGGTTGDGLARQRDDVFRKIVSQERFWML